MPRTPDAIRKDLHEAEEAARAASIKVDALYIELRDALRNPQPEPVKPAPVKEAKNAPGV